VVISPSDINSYKVHDEGKYRMHVLQIFLAIKTFCSGKHDTVSVAVLTFKVTQGQ